MNVKELAARVATQLGYNEDEARAVCVTFLDEVQGALLDGETVKLRGVGTLKWQVAAPRMNKPPGGGKARMLERRLILKFRPSTKLRSPHDGEVRRRLGRRNDETS
jgi:nucleoid DNA-binding protein